MVKTPKSYKFSEITLQRINDIVAWLPAESATHAIEEAIARMHYRLERRREMDKREATRLAKEAIQTVAVGDPSPVADMTVLFLNEDGTYSVVDNGEEVDGLDEQNAIRIIVENLTA